MTYRPILKFKEMRAQRQVPVVKIIIYFQKVLIWEERACACVRHVLPVGGCQEVKGTVAWKSANWRKRGRRTRTFKYLPFSSILSFVLLHTFLLNVLGEFLQGNEVCQITRTLSRKESVLGQGFTPTHQSVVTRRELHSVSPTSFGLWYQGTGFPHYPKV